jgi:tetratricopeptide (TPR) repeat protein
VSDSPGYLDVPVADRAKAKAFFDRAASLVSAGQYDYALEMYLNGLKLDPEAVDAHQALRDAALRRKAGGGKGLGMLAAMKYPTKGKDERQNMSNAERVLAWDPGDTGAMLSVLETAYRAGCYDTVLWIGPILNRANGELPKPDFNKFKTLRDIYAKLKRWTDAVAVCTRMVQMRPDDMDLKNDLKNLSAEEAMNKGQYSKSYRESIRDSSKQQALLEEERDNVSEEYTDKVAREAAADLATNPEDPTKVSKYVDALRKTGRPADEEKAIKLLSDTFERTGAYKFRLSMIDMRLKHLQHQDRDLRADIAKSPGDAEKIQAYKEFRRARAEEELTLFTEVAEQYPSELKYRFEMAKRMVDLEKYTDAIPHFQTAVNDPKLRMHATLGLGQTFLAAEFPDEAADTLQGLSETYPAITAGDDMAKAIMYWLGRAQEEKGNVHNNKNDWQSALKSYSTVVKWDFNYRDTQARIKALRIKATT